MTSIRREIKGVVADQLASWAFTLDIWAHRLDPTHATPAQEWRDIKEAWRELRDAERGLQATGRAMLTEASRVDHS